MFRLYAATTAVLIAGCANLSSMPSHLPGEPDPRNPLIFPSPRPSTTVEPAVACPGTQVTLQASRLPPNSSIEVWFKGSSAGGFKLGNPPLPGEFGAVKLGSATTEAAGSFTFKFDFTSEMAAGFGNNSNAYELWLVYPTANGKTPIQPGAAGFQLCSFSIYLAAPVGHTVRVGERLRLTASNTHGKPIVWQISEEDMTQATIQTTTDPSLGSVGTVHAIAPGGVRVIAGAGDKRAEALIATLDPATTSSPVPMPSELPLQAPNMLAGARLVTDIASWNNFIGEIRETPRTGAIAPPPIDLTTRSLVAVVLDALQNTGAPVVTHIEEGITATVHVVQPRIIGYMVPEPGGFPPGVITLLSIPKVSADANVNLRTIAPAAQ